MDDVWRDLRFGIRMLVKAPGFTVVAVLTLALGIGANTALFSVMHAILLRPLPYQESERLVFLTEWSEQIQQMSFSVANLKDVRDQNAVFEALVGYNGANFVLAGEGGEAERLSGRQVTSGLFATLRKTPILGRPFTADEEKVGAERVALLGEGFWQRRFARDPGVIGRSLTLGGESFTVIGVLPQTMHGAWKTIDVFTPLLRLEDKIGGEENRGNHPGIYVVARLKPGVTVERARADVVAIAQRLAEQYPDSNAKQSMTLEPLHEAYVGDLRPALLLLLGAVGFVLLIACGNVANLLLARAAHREKEVAVRMALGAGRRRLVRQLLTESVVLSLVGAALGLLFAYAGVKGLLAALPANIPRADEIRLDTPVLLFTVVVALLCGLVFGIAPAWKVSGLNVHDPLRDSRAAVGSAHRRARHALVVAEISLALVLLVGAGLLLRSFFRVLDADPGVRVDGVLTASVPLPAQRFDKPEKKAAFAERLAEQLRTLPGVQAAALALPLLGGWQSSFSVEGKPEPPPGQRPSADVTRVTSDYFRAMGVRLLQGRVFEERDRSGAPAVCMVDETFAKAHWPGDNPLGKRVKIGGLQDAEQPWMEVVGLVGHVKNYGVDEDSRVELYLPYLQSSPGSALTIVVRTTGDPAGLGPGVRQAVRAVDPEIPVYSVRTLSDIAADRSAQRRLAVVLLGVFAGLALLLAAVGIYGVMSYTVTQRRQEIGVRMALGAERADILGMVLRSGAAMALTGVGIGLLVALGLARLITSLLFQTSATDPPTFSVVPVLLMAVALLACYIPARRATRVDPLVALRYE